MASEPPMTVAEPAPIVEAPTPEVAPAAKSVTETLYPDDTRQPAQDEPVAAIAAPEDPEGDEEGKQEEPEAEPIAAPTSWAKDAKEVFAALPREAQEVIAKREAERESFVQSKSREAATTRQQVETEAHTVIQQLMQNHAQQLETYAQQFEAPRPDIRLLQSADPQHRELYYQQKDAYEYATAQRDALAQQVEQARQQATFAEQQQGQAELQRELAMLQERLPEWSDPSERAKLLSDIQPIAAELGYSPELMAQARAQDILALKTAHGWREDALKYRDLMKRKMEPVRAAKQLPPVARAGAPTGQAKPAGVISTLYPNDPPRR